MLMTSQQPCKLLATQSSAIGLERSFSANPSEFEYRIALLRGVYDYEHAILVGPKTFESIHGFNLIVPFHTAGAPPILVNRGFVSTALVNAGALRTLATTPVLLHGLLRAKPRRYWLSPENDPAQNAWHWVDVDTICKIAGLANAESAIFIEEIFDGDRADMNARLSQGEPVGRERTVQLRNTPATYAVIW
jgi:surfeit locus 1 family protein